MAIISITVYATNGNEAENRSDANNGQSSTIKTTRNPYVDIFVAIITVPTLILLALLLDANIQDNIETTVDNRSSFIVLIFGFAFLVLSSLVCGCIVHKMGMCRWNRQDDDITRANQTENLDCVYQNQNTLTRCVNHI